MAYSEGNGRLIRGDIPGVAVDVAVVMNAVNGVGVAGKVRPVVVKRKYPTVSNDHARVRRQ